MDGPTGCHVGCPQTDLVSFECAASDSRVRQQTGVGLTGLPLGRGGFRKLPVPGRTPRAESGRQHWCSPCLSFLFSLWCLVCSCCMLRQSCQPRAMLSMQQARSPTAKSVPAGALSCAAPGEACEHLLSWALGVPADLTVSPLTCPVCVGNAAGAVYLSCVVYRSVLVCVLHAELPYAVSSLVWV